MSTPMALYGGKPSAEHAIDCDNSKSLMSAQFNSNMKILVRLMSWNVNELSVCMCTIIRVEASSYAREWRTGKESDWKKSSKDIKKFKLTALVIDTQDAKHVQLCSTGVALNADASSANGNGSKLEHEHDVKSVLVFEHLLNNGISSS